MSRDALWMLMQSMQRETRWSSPVQFAVLVILADSMNEKGDPKRGIPRGWAWPSKNTIAKRVKCSSRYVVKVMSGLEALGLIEIRRGARPQGVNLYCLTSAVQFTHGGETSGLTSAVEFTPGGPATATTLRDVRSLREMYSLALNGVRKEILDEVDRVAAPQ